MPSSNEHCLVAALKRLRTFAVLRGLLRALHHATTREARTKQRQFLEVQAVRLGFV
jgi:hypothetical protein